MRIEDASYGFYLHQLVEAVVTGVNIADNIDEHYAMDAKSCTEVSHPNSCWSPLRNESWLIHHMKPEQQVCMFKKDVAGGMYVTFYDEHQSQQQQVQNQNSFKHQVYRSWLQNFGGELKYTNEES